MATTPIAAPQEPTVITGTIGPSDDSSSGAANRSTLIKVLQDARQHGVSDDYIADFLSKDKNYGPLFKEALQHVSPTDAINGVLGPYGPNQPTGNSIHDPNASNSTLENVVKGAVDMAIKAPLEAAKHYLWDVPPQHSQEINDKVNAGDIPGAIRSALAAGVYMATGNGFLQDQAKNQWQQFEKAADVLTDPKQGDMAGRISQALGYTAAGLLPMVGPAAAKVGEDFGTNPAYALGEGLGLVAVPKLAGKATDAVLSRAAGSIPVLPKVPVQLDPSEAAAVNWMRQNNIPVDAATATGNQVVRNFQGLARNLPGTAGPAKTFFTNQKNALESAGSQLADRVSPNPATAETSGASVNQALDQHAENLGNAANGAYTRLRNIEQASAPQTVQVGTAKSSVLGANGQPVTVPLTKQITAPVDLTTAKAALKPIADELDQVLTPAQHQFSKGLTAIKGVLGAPDRISASVADQTLSGLKAILGEDVPAKTKYIVGKVIDELSPQVDASVAKLGPAATQALQDGRALTKAKYAVKDTQGLLSDEPVQIYRKLTQSKDANIELLRDVAAKVPSAIPALARATIDGLIEKAYAEVGQAKPGTVLTEWNKLGDSTKAVLFKDPALVKDLDNFFNATKMVASNPNPSGSGYMAALAGDGALLFSAPHFAIPYMIGRTALGRVLLSPGGAKVLTEGLRIPIANNARNAMVAGRILQLAGADAKPTKNQ